MTPEQIEFIRGFKTVPELARMFQRARDAGKVTKRDWIEWVKVWHVEPEKPKGPISHLDKDAREIFNIKD